ncbi:MAG: hypothetical protein KBI01_10010, partial [Oscillospiraceae bacterium]|nr:hypothetical protein [Oscillospiraceae bacterium]
MTNTPDDELDPRKMDDLYRAFENADYILGKRYRHVLENQPVCELPEAIRNIKVGDNFQVFRISKLVY